jgi:hypothetical protein
VSDGSWEWAARSRFRLIYRRFNEPTVDLTETILGSLGQYDTRRTGSDSVFPVRERCAALIERTLGIREDPRRPGDESSFEGFHRA